MKLTNFLSFNIKVDVLRGAIEHAKKHNRPVVKYYYLQGSLAIIVDESDEYKSDSDLYYVTGDYNKLGDMDDDVYIAMGCFQSKTDELEGILNEHGDHETLHVTMKHNLDILLNGHCTTLARLTCFESPEGGLTGDVDQETGVITYKIRSSGYDHYVKYCKRG